MQLNQRIRGKETKSNNWAENQMTWKLANWGTARETMRNKVQRLKTRVGTDAERGESRVSGKIGSPPISSPTFPSPSLSFPPSWGWRLGFALLLEVRHLRSFGPPKGRFFLLNSAGVGHDIMTDIMTPLSSHLSPRWHRISRTKMKNIIIYV